MLAVILLTGTGLSLLFSSMENRRIAYSEGYPTINQVKYSFYVKRVDATLLSNAYSKVEQADSTLYILHGYYEFRGSQWRYDANNKPLDTRVVGEIVLTDRRD